MKQGWSLQGNYDTIAVVKITKKYLTLIHTKKAQEGNPVLFVMQRYFVEVQLL